MLREAHLILSDMDLISAIPLCSLVGLICNFLAIHGRAFVVRVLKVFGSLCLLTQSYAFIPS